MIFLFFSSVLHGNQQLRISVRDHLKELIEICEESTSKTPNTYTLCAYNRNDHIDVKGV